MYHVFDFRKGGLAELNKLRLLASLLSERMCCCVQALLLCTSSAVSNVRTPWSKSDITTSIYRVNLKHIWLLDTFFGCCLHYSAAKWFPDFPHICFAGAPSIQQQLPPPPPLAQSLPLPPQKFTSIEEALAVIKQVRTGKRLL